MSNKKRILSIFMVLCLLLLNFSSVSAKSFNTGTAKTSYASS